MGTSSLCGLHVDIGLVAGDVEALNSGLGRGRKGSNGGNGSGLHLEYRIQIRWKRIDDELFSIPRRRESAIFIPEC